MRVNDAIFESYSNLLKAQGLTKEPSIDEKIKIDTYGLVNLIIDVEEKLGVSLDSAISEVKQSKTLLDVIESIQNSISVLN
ncbi:hypothetical protein [Clostridium cellulovorans]|uniref:Carrier domain-containing protein n=1 Tax=Clostridium cellulovorans (strain ATCC 35296 / DSM 3052 / OCM 3 / 743B) TaxID=573061 RepID=D9SMX4_CLOC7|nr:hypothetical protein [Clostridium cellulovorans]ADL51840.1 hypothetical protein Clocel_2097 [Clostridium cellulovorans 743B]